MGDWDRFAAGVQNSWANQNSRETGTGTPRGEFDDLFSRARKEVEVRRSQETHKPIPTLQDLLRERQRTLRLASVASATLSAAGVVPDKEMQPIGRAWKLSEHSRKIYHRGDETDTGTNHTYGVCMGRVGDLYRYIDAHVHGNRLGDDIRLDSTDTERRALEEARRKEGPGAGAFYHFYLPFGQGQFSSSTEQMYQGYELELQRGIAILLAEKGLV